MTADELAVRIEAKRAEVRRTTEPRNRFALEKQLNELIIKRAELLREAEAASK